MVRVDIICGYLVAPEQLRKFADSQSLRYDPGGDLVLLHNGVIRWVEEHKTPIQCLWDVEYPRLVSPIKAGSRILIPTRRRTAVHTFQFKEKDIDRAVLRKVLDHPQLSPLGVDATFVTCPDPDLQWTLPGEEYPFFVRIFSNRLTCRMRYYLSEFCRPRKMMNDEKGNTFGQKAPFMLVMIAIGQEVCLGSSWAWI
ncbi:hypothetical protein BGW80DRAFT_730300 [Lactifluus volemus]|nr:hypothetical protein BGW80DRAFT_730300 [Lactifluus volemus]